MTWLFYAITSQLVYTIVVFIDKYIISKEVKDYQGLVIFTTILGFLTGTLFWIAAGFPILPYRDALIVIGSGVLLLWGTYFYFKALASDESSTVILLMQMIPMFVGILAFFLLKETITLQQFVGFLLIFIAGTAMSLEGTDIKIRISPIFFQMIIVDIFWAASAVLFKFASEANSFAKIVSFGNWGVTIGGTLVYCAFPAVRRSFHKTLKKLRRRTTGMICLNEGAAVLAKSLQYFAYSLGPATLVSIISVTQVFMGIYIGWVLTLILPKVIKEDIGKRTLLKKSIFAGLSLLGIILIY